jgi:hypothetical protein
MRDYALSILARSIRMEVRLNDVPLFRDDVEGNFGDENYVNEYTAAGDNELLLRVWPRADAAQPPPDARALVEFLEVERGQPIVAGIPLAEAAWSTAEDMPPPTVYPRAVRTTVNVTAPDHRGWRTAPSITLDDPTRSEILRVLRELHDAMRDRRLNTVVRILRQKISERAAAYAFPPDEKLADLRTNYRELMARADWTMEPMGEEDVALELVAEQRLVNVTNGDGRPPIRTGDLGGMRLVVPVQLTRIENRWIILR